MKWNFCYDYIVFINSHIKNSIKNKIIKNTVSIKNTVLKKKMSFENDNYYNNYENIIKGPFYDDIENSTNKNFQIMMVNTI